MVTGRSAGHQIAPIAGPPIGREPVPYRPVHEGEQIVRHSDIEIGAFARRFALTQCEQDVHHSRIGTTSDVGDERRRHHPMPGRARGHSQKSGIADVVQVVTRGVTARTGLAVTGDSAIDKFWIDFAQSAVAKTQSLHYAWTKLLNDDITAFHELQDALARLQIFEIYGEAFLAAIEQRKIDTVLAPDRSIVAHFFAARAFDLNHLRTSFSKEQRRHRPRQQRREIEDAYPCEWAHYYPPYLATNAYRPRL